MVDVLWNVSRTNQKIEEAELNVVSAPGLFFIIFVWFQQKNTSVQNLYPKRFSLYSNSRGCRL